MTNIIKEIIKEEISSLKKLENIIKKIENFDKSYYENNRVPSYGDYYDFLVYKLKFPFLGEGENKAAFKIDNFTVLKISTETSDKSTILDEIELSKKMIPFSSKIIYVSNYKGWFICEFISPIGKNINWFKSLGIYDFLKKYYENYNLKNTIKSNNEFDILNHMFSLLINIISNGSWKLSLSDIFGIEEIENIKNNDFVKKITNIVLNNNAAADFNTSNIGFGTDGRPVILDFEKK